MIQLRTFLAGGWLATALIAGAAPAPAPDQLLPDDTLAFLSVPETAKARTFLETSPSTGFMRDPAMKPFYDNFWAVLRTNAIAPLEKALLIKPEDYQGLMQGQLTLAVIQGDWKGEKGTEPGLVAVLDTRDKAAQLKETLAKLKKSWGEAGRKLRTDTIRDVEFTTWLTTQDEVEALFPNDADEDEDEEESDEGEKKPETFEISIGQSDSLLVIGTQAKAIERVLIRQAGGSVAPVADAPAFQVPKNKIFRDAMAYGWASPQPVLKLALEQAPKGQSPIDPKTIAEALGLFGLKSASFAVKLSDDGSLVDLLLGQPAGERKGILSLLAGEAKPADLPAFIPADVLSASRYRLDLAKLWNGIEKLVGELNPQAKATLGMVLAGAGKDVDPNFDVRKELFGNLGDDLIVYQKAPAEITVEAMAKQRSIVLIGSPAPDRLAIGIKALIGSLGGPAAVKERELLGRKVYRIGAETGGVDFTASGGYLAISPDPAVLEEFLRSGDGKNKPLRETEGLAAAAEKVGGTGTGLFAFQNQKEQTRLGIGFAKLVAAEAEDPSETAIGAVLGDTLGLMFDYKLHPPFEQVAKYFGFTVMAGEVDADGYRLRVYGPTPAGARQ